MNKQQAARLRRILAYTLSGQQSYESCDIDTRAEIDRLLPAIGRVFPVQQPYNYWVLQSEIGDKVTYYVMRAPLSATWFHSDALYYTGKSVKKWAKLKSAKRFNHEKAAYIVMCRLAGVKS